MGQEGYCEIIMAVLQPFVEALGKSCSAPALPPGLGADTEESVANSLKGTATILPHRTVTIIT